MPTPQATKYLALYEQDVIVRDNTLSLYDTFLRNMGESKTLIQIIQDLLKEKKRIRLLDIGCGNAQVLHELKTHFGDRVHTMGVDLLPPFYPPDEFLQGDVHELPLPLECDLILSFRALHEMGNLPSLLPRIARALGKGGKAYLWVRLRVIEANSDQLEGEMTPTDEAFLEASAPRTKWGETFALVDPILGEFIPKSGVLQEIARGYAIVLHRP
ncbi:MAG: class I SAM-dependent methyltransferase [Candidatus Diapherotrites archaeon]|nr:class I SAM-dependent methyltransferase [Candidatus Diapherotrites archaeon]MDZ4256716.1 class I SAM-dependent methyltransferase [archaeon]